MKLEQTLRFAGKIQFLELANIPPDFSGSISNLFSPFRFSITSSNVTKGSPKQSAVMPKRQMANWNVVRKSRTKMALAKTQKSKMLLKKKKKLKKSQKKKKVINLIPLLRLTSKSKIGMLNW